jgi:hypothetical protein
MENGQQKVVVQAKFLRVTKWKGLNIQSRNTRFEACKKGITVSG